MTFSTLKNAAAKAITVGALAGAAVVLASPAKAQAQGFGLNVQFGQPYVQYGVRPERSWYGDRDRWEETRQREAFERQEAWDRQQARERHEAWEREQRFDRRGGYERFDHGDTFRR